MRPVRRPQRRGLVALTAFAVLAAGAGAALTARAARSGDAPPPSAWRDGAAGYRQAAGEAARDGRPLLVYFRTDWCPYCREFERELLASGEVETYLRGVARARVNPETGKDEESLASIYGVTGYPAMFVQRGASDPPRRISRSIRGAGGEPRLKTPGEFIATLREAAEAPR